MSSSRIRRSFLVLAALMLLSGPRPAAHITSEVVFAATTRSQGQASGTYSITELPVPVPAEYWAPVGINQQGVVVGTLFRDGVRQTIRWTNAVPELLGDMFPHVNVTGINSSGAIVGWAYDGLRSLGVLFSNGAWSVLPSLTDGHSQPLGIRDDGTIVGNSTNASGVQAAVMWQNGVVTELWSDAGPSDADSINDAGQIVGGSYDGAPGPEHPNARSHAVLYQNQTRTLLPCLFPGHSYAVAINRSGTIAGYCPHPAGSYRATIWQDGQALEDDTNFHSDFFAINNPGEAVGYYKDVNGLPRAMLYRNGTLIDLNTLLAPGSGWQLMYGLDINDAGWIVGNGLLHGEWAAFLMKPAAPTNVAPTPAGSDVVLQPTATLPGGSTSTVSLTFASVTAGGATTVATSTSGPPPPNGFRLGQPPIYYDVSTTATFTGTVTLCFSWAEGALHNEANARLLHYENNAWVDITTSVDTDTNRICGAATSLSPFAIAELAYEFMGFQVPLLADGSASIQQTRAGRTLPVKFQLRFGGQLTGETTARIAVYRILNVATGTVDTTDLTDDAGAANETSDRFRYDGASQQFIFNLQTKGWLAPATYRIVVTFGDGTTQTIDFSLR